MKARPIRTIAVVIPISWLRCTFLISPENDVDATANQIENAGQSMNFIVAPKLKAGPGATPALTPSDTIFWYVPAPARSLKRDVKSRTPVAPSSRTRSVTARLPSARYVAQRCHLKYTPAPRIWR